MPTSAYAATRAHYRLSQEQWAQAFGVSRSSVSAWELGRVPPPPAAQAAYRKLQEPILRSDLGGIEHWRERLLAIADEAQTEAEKLNRARGRRGNGLVKAIVVTAAALAIAKLLGELFGEE